MAAHGRWRAVAALMAGALAVAGCGPDAGVSQLGASPIPSASSPTATTPAGGLSDGGSPSSTTPATTPGTQPPATTGPTVVTTTPLSDTIAEPELYIDVPIGDVVNVGDSKTPRDYDSFLAVALTDIEQWLADEVPTVWGTPWTPISGGIWAGYPGRHDDIPGCDQAGPTTYQELTEYAAFYCEYDDFMAYDDGHDGILVQLADELGPSVLGIVLAHEYGHAVQQRVGILDQNLATVITEQQADCISGAWVGRTYDGNSPDLRLGDADLRAGLVAMVEVRDPVGSDQFAEGGHGTAFDRVGAFQAGFTGGLERCSQLIADPLPLMPNVFQPASLDEYLQGNAPYDCNELPVDLRTDCVPAPTFLAEDLNNYWQTIDPTFPTLTAVPVQDFASFSCPDEVPIDPFDLHIAYCPRDQGVAYDEPYILDLYRQYGDFTLGYFYGITWAEVEQFQDGSTLTGESRALLDDCWTGAWVADITPDASGHTPREGDHNGDGVDDTVTSSPGDLDEAVRMAILLGDLGINVNQFGSPFEKIASFRTGVLGGIDACPSPTG